MAVLANLQRGDSSEAAFMKFELFMLESSYRRVVNRMSRPTSETHDNLELCIYAGDNRLVIYTHKLPWTHSETQAGLGPHTISQEITWSSSVSQTAAEWLLQPGTQDAVRQGTTQPKGLMIMAMLTIGRREKRKYSG
jgi:hypothetical protein